VKNSQKKGFYSQIHMVYYSSALDNQHGGIGTSAWFLLQDSDLLIYIIRYWPFLILMGLGWCCRQTFTIDELQCGLLTTVSTKQLCDVPTSNWVVYRLLSVGIDLDNQKAQAEQLAGGHWIGCWKAGDHEFHCTSLD
jgi:hypothetical protein